MGTTGQGVRGDDHEQINIFCFRVFQLQQYMVLLSFSTYYLGILGLEGL